MRFVTDEKELKELYLEKLKPELREAVMKNTWPFEGEEEVYRKPRTWQEVGMAVEWELTTRAEIKAPMHGGKDTLHLLGPGFGGSGGDGTAKCSYGHWCRFDGWSDGLYATKQHLLEVCLPVGQCVPMNNHSDVAGAAARRGDDLEDHPLRRKLEASEVQ